jgi:hypothetical protein
MGGCNLSPQPLAPLIGGYWVTVYRAIVQLFYEGLDHDNYRDLNRKNPRLGYTVY